MENCPGDVLIDFTPAHSGCRRHLRRPHNATALQLPSSKDFPCYRSGIGFVIVNCLACQGYHLALLPENSWIRNVLASAVTTEGVNSRSKRSFTSGVRM